MKKRILLAILSVVLIISLIQVAAPAMAAGTAQTGGYGANGKFIAPIDIQDPNAIPIYTAQDLRE